MNWRARPHILARLVEITNGRGIRANIALVQFNARPAAVPAAACQAVLHDPTGRQ